MQEAIIDLFHHSTSTLGIHTVNFRLLIIKTPFRTTCHVELAQYRAAEEKCHSRPSSSTILWPTGTTG
ncbi:hypothetical protein OESDEN_04907 [Oesophagostomum dentatum]|uniref:Uncharacterized protein n=1 Tax=Oesophagostomum dentatum TaxID=61180 RepID=A0A0B1TGG2_OESDE|nr:hypothetical protein OESDEN_04907 [Oesophagostomum dentatum]